MTGMLRALVGHIRERQCMQRQCLPPPANFSELPLILAFISAIFGCMTQIPQPSLPKQMASQAEFIVNNLKQTDYTSTARACAHNTRSSRWRSSLDSRSIRVTPKGRKSA